MFETPFVTVTVEVIIGVRVTTRTVRRLVVFRNDQRSAFLMHPARLS